MERYQNKLNYRLDRFERRVNMFLDKLFSRPNTLGVIYFPLVSLISYYVFEGKWELVVLAILLGTLTLVLFGVGLLLLWTLVRGVIYEWDEDHLAWRKENTLRG